MIYRIERCAEGHVMAVHWWGGLHTTFAMIPMSWGAEVNGRGGQRQPAEVRTGQRRDAHSPARTTCNFMRANRYAGNVCRDACGH